MITDLPNGTRAVSVWITEDKNGSPGFGAIRYDTKSVQIQDSTCRIFFDLRATPGEEWATGAMVFMGL